MEKTIDAMYFGTGLSQLPSPWLQVLVLMAALAIWLCAVAVFIVWLYKTAIKSLANWVHIPEVGRLANAGIALITLGLVGFSSIVAALVFGLIGQTTRLGRDPAFLAYWVILLFLSVGPLYFIVRRTGLLKNGLLE